MKKDLAVIILAAGLSSRLGNMIKQLLKYKDTTLLKIACQKALEVSNDVFIVLGYEKEACQKEIKDLNVNILFNENYKKGIGSSISFGISHTKDYENTLIILCDQPFISIKHLRKLEKNINNETIIATKYEQLNNSTVPAIFPKKYYKKLLELKEDKGARDILKEEKCINISIENKESIDIDTLEDVNNHLHL